ncbi:prolipoprotein diacylglyceryl transferase [Gaetbulibacter saemankumensis]|uniref:prolipoprotein diacylglyceryl transferase n=1 Tax=Gaetbulibacter saemankumensis TaxID=311208 RepID=UPI00040CE19D|nr:prolipoprotein diacylglyceryl transferase family protein [Gaetbulibacter saemankumensis]
MEITIANPKVLFKLFYLLAFTFIFIVVLVKSQKRGYHLRSVLLMLTTISLFTVIGSRLFTIPVTEWYTAIYQNPEMFNNRSSIGGLLFGLVGLIISQRIFGFNRPMLDLYAWMGIVAIGIIKFGCLFNGCCYGVPTNSFVGVQYPPGTHAHFNQWVSGFIENTAALSSPIHPVQLYESLLLFIAGFVVYKTHKKWKKNASALLFSLSLFFIIRFGIEFVRDAQGSQFNNLYYFGLRSYQWSMLGYAFLFILLLYIYERRTKIEWVKGLQNSPYIHADFIYVTIIAILIYTFKNLFSPYELAVIWIKFIPAIMLSLYYLYSDSRLKRYRFITTVILLAPLYVLAQTIPDKTLESKYYKRIDVGGSFGNFANSVNYNPQEGECGTSYSSQYFKQVYQVGGLGYSNVKIDEKKTFTYGANISGGNIKSTNLQTQESQSEFILAINPYLKLDRKWIGGGIGLQLGKLRLNKDEFYNSDNIKDAQKEYNVLPEFYLRVGPRKYLDIDYNYGFIMPSAFPTLQSRSSIGSAFGLSEDYSLRYGRIWNLETDYIAAQALITKQFGINIMYVFKEQQFDYLGDSPSGKFVLSVNYRFGHR